MPGVSPRSGGRRRTISEINMVPFIDVMLVLLIIFMVTAPLITTGVVDVPSVGKSGKGPERFVGIEIASDQKMRLRVGGKEGVAVDMKNLAAQVRDLQAGDVETPVVISADRSVKYEVVVKVMDTLQRSGVKRVGLSVKNAGGS